MIWLGIVIGFVLFFFGNMLYLRQRQMPQEYQNSFANWKRIWKEREVQQKVKYWGFVLFRWGYGLTVLILLLRNLDSIFQLNQLHNKKINDFASLKSALFNDVNVGMALLGTFLGLAVLLYFVIRLPFLNLEQFKFFGVEYKVQAEKQKEVAKAEFDTFRAIEQARMSIINQVSDEGMYHELKGFIEGETLNMTEALMYLAEVISLLYAGNKPAFAVRAGVITVNDGQLDSETEKELLQAGAVVHKAKRTGEHDSYHDGKVSTIAIPVHTGFTENEYAIFYMQSNDIIFIDTDALLIKAQPKSSWIMQSGMWKSNW